MRRPALPFGAVHAWALVLAGLTTTPMSAAAAPSLAPLARSLQGPARDAYEASKVLVANDDFRGALVKLEQAYDLSKDPRLLYNMALCHKNLHAYASMERLLEQYEREAASRMTPSERAAVDSALAATAGLVGEVKVTVTPDGAHVLVDGATVGTSPLKESVLVDLGRHTVKAEKEGFDGLEKSVEVPGGSVTELALGLTEVGSITVTTDAAAAATIDGSPVDLGHPHVKVRVGIHTVRVTQTGKAAYQAELEVRGGENRTVEVTLQDEKRHAVWPWILGSAVAVAAGAAVGGYFLLSPSTTVTPPPVGKLGNVTFSSVRLR